MRAAVLRGVGLLLVATAGMTHAADRGALGDWNGLRPALAAHGVALKAEYTSETATNLAGGDHRRLRETGQLTLGATLDLGELADLENGTLQASITYRRGEDLGAAANLDVLQQVQEVYGRGQTWRLTQLWYEHRFPAADVAMKIGRMTVGEDFAAFSCEFQNLTFCGAPPGNIVGNYWYNWPVSQWGMRLRATRDWGYIQAGVYEVNPANLDNDFRLGHFSGATGVLTPVEIALEPRLGSVRQPGSYKLGAWHDSSDADDIYRDRTHQPRHLTGLAAIEQSGRHGVYLNIEQQLTGERRAGERRAGESLAGLTLFFNATQADRSTATVDNQLALGLFYTGPLPTRPGDRVGVAVGRTHVNHRAAPGEAEAGRQPHAEIAVELFYRMQATPWLTLAPNLQLIRHPGGFDDRDEVVVLGLKAIVGL